MFDFHQRVNVPSAHPRKPQLSKTERLNEYRAHLLSSIGKLSDKDTTKQGVSELLTHIDRVHPDQIPLLIVRTLAFLFVLLL